jgi:uncharacterized protein
MPPCSGGTLVGHLASGSGSSSPGRSSSGSTDCSLDMTHASSLSASNCMTTYPSCRLPMHGAERVSHAALPTYPRGAVHTPTAPSPRPGWLPVIVVVGVLVVSNVMSNEVLPWGAYLSWNLAMTAVLLWIALRLDTNSLGELGLSRSGWRRGALVGGGVLAGITAVLLIGALLPATRGLFEDERVAGTSAWAMVYQVMVRIPFGTVVLEEVAFRGVLLGMLLRRTSRARAVAGSSVLFGLWHVLPSIGVEATNPVLADLFGGTGGAVAAVVLAVVGTALAGVALCILRFVGHSLLAPMLAHVATNSVGFVVAWFVIRAD